MAVRIDIRPRIVLKDEQPAKPRRQWRMPPLALPAAGYWLAMGALTYFFAHLGPNPLENAWASEPLDEDVAAPSPAPVNEPGPAPIADLAAAPEVALTHPPVATETDAAPQRAETTPEPVTATEDEPERRVSEDQKTTRRETSSRRRAEEHEAPLARRDEPAARLEFPEFTDSSRSAPRERAADGPRIDALFERREERTDRSSPAPEQPTAPERGAAVAVSSCEAAIARNNEHLEIGGARGPADVSREQYAGILQNGRYLAGCSVPDRTVFEICAAVRDGRAVGITVTSSPPNASLNACVRRAVSSLKFPSSPRLDVTHTRFDAARR